MSESPSPSETTLPDKIWHWCLLILTEEQFLVTVIDSSWQHVIQCQNQALGSVWRDLSAVSGNQHERERERESELKWVLMDLAGWSGCSALLILLLLQRTGTVSPSTQRWWCHTWNTVASFGPPLQEGCGDTGEFPVESWEDDQGPRAHNLWGKVEKTGFI